MPDQVDWRTMEREASPGRAVGRLLRDQREARGLDLKAVEVALRIRLQYLEAIEQGRFDLLPGAAYIPAFLRSYAQFVGLDPEKVLTAYHLSGAVPIKRSVALPADFPLVEKRAPIGLAVLTVLLVIGAGYAMWHYLPRQQTVIAEKVPPVPDRLLASRPATVEPSGNTASPAATTELAAPPPTQTQPAQTPPIHTQEARSAPAPLPPNAWPIPRQDSLPAPPPAVVAVPASPPPVVMALPSAGQAQAAQPPAPEPVRPAPAAEPQEAVARSAPASAAPAVAPLSPPTPIASTPSPASTPAVDVTAQPTPPVKADTRVVVRRNSWVELRAPDGDILAQTYVRAGESYTVPAGIAYRIIDAR